MQKEYDVSESGLIKVVNDKCAHRRRGRRPGQYSQEKYKMQKKRWEERKARREARRAAKKKENATAK